jgi:carnitine O-palmitoyltransferase 1
MVSGASGGDDSGADIDNTLGAANLTLKKKKQKISYPEASDTFTMRRSHSTGMHLNRSMKNHRPLSPRIYGGPGSDGSISLETAERQVAALTSLPREQWANIQEEYFSHGVNKISLREIERALFVVVLDHGKHDSLSERGAALFHGDGTNRWFDKSMQLIVFADGHIGLNAEHSWADAPVTGHMWEHVLCHELQGSSMYSGDGHTRGYKHRSAGVQLLSELGKSAAKSGSRGNTEPISKSSRPQRLRFSLGSESCAAVLSAAAEARANIQNLELHVFGWNEFGKSFIKKCGLSPDAFLQMALQLAYYCDSGKKLALTYEASMTRLFKEGRTETVRSLTQQSAEFVRAMAGEDGDVKEGVASTVKKKRDLLRKACARHTSVTIDAMSGQGLDRHLFALYVVATGMGEDSPFLKTALTQPWRLSTSQTPARQTDVWDLLPEELSALQDSVPGGGFGPVADDGYGVSYLVAGENRFFFHVSSKRSSTVTNSARFAKAVRQALVDMRALF